MPWLSLDGRGVQAIVVGGTGQYVRALRQGWDFGGAPPGPGRAELTAQAGSPSGLAALVAEVRSRDPAAATTLDLANPRRVIRALELLREGNGSLAAARHRIDGRALAVVVLDADRDLHAAALAARLDAMFDGAAIVAETRAELDRGVAAAALRRAGIGYAEALEVLAGSLDLPGAKAGAARRTARYVKAQRTWFRHEPAVLRLQRRAGDSTADLAGAVVAALTTPAGSPR